MTVTIAEKDKTYIREEYKKNPTMAIATIKRLASKYECSFGDIQWVLGKLADPIREANRKRQQTANEREKAKIVEIRQRKQEAQDGAWDIPESISKRMVLKLTSDQEDSLIQLSFKLKAYTCYAIKVMSSQVGYPIIRGKLPKPENGSYCIPEDQVRNQYDTVKAFLTKSDKLSAKTLDVLQRTKIKAMVQSSIRKPRMPDFMIPFQGTHGNTAGNAKVVQMNGKFYLRFNKMDLEILFQDHDDYYDSGIETPLRQLFEKGETPSGEIFKAENGTWVLRFSLKRKEPDIKFDENSKPIFIVVQPSFTQIGCKWIAYFYNELNQLIFKTTILRDVAWIRILHTEQGYIKYYTAKATDQLMNKTWHRRFMNMKPIVIQLNAVGKVPSQTVANLNPINKFKFKMQDKLAQYNGDGYTLSHCSNNIEEIRARLSI